jgi:GGDEF domain-containing protein
MNPSVSAVNRSVWLRSSKCSIGAVVFIDREGTQDDFLRLADTAMYQAKNAGSNLIRLSEAKCQS